MARSERRSQLLLQSTNWVTPQVGPWGPWGGRWGRRGHACRHIEARAMSGAATGRLLIQAWQALGRRPVALEVRLQAPTRLCPFLGPSSCTTHRLWISGLKRLWKTLCRCTPRRESASPTADSVAPGALVARQAAAEARAGAAACARQH